MGGQWRHYEEESYQGSTAPKEYAFKGKIMVSAVVILFAVIVLMVVLHIYARWYILRARRRHLSRLRSSRTHVFYYVDPATNPAAAPPGGLHPSVVSSLPLFTYSPESHPDALECAVCLSELEEKDSCRQLPKCSHSFHVACIDMWFHSHSTCPICRAPVDDETPAPLELNNIAISVAAEPAESETTTTISSAMQHGDSTSHLNDSTTASLGARRKVAELVGVSVEVPGRSAAVSGRSEDESGVLFQSPAFKSPGGRIRSLKRILSRDIRAAASLISPSAPSCSSLASEADWERGKNEETHHPSRAQTPR